MVKNDGITGGPESVGDLRLDKLRFGGGGGGRGSRERGAAQGGGGSGLWGRFGRGGAVGGMRALLFLPSLGNGRPGVTERFTGEGREVLGVPRYCAGPS
jgi:hypothetical protein